MFIQPERYFEHDKGEQRRIISTYAKSQFCECEIVEIISNGATNLT